MILPETITEELEELRKEMSKDPTDILKLIMDEFRFRKSLSLSLKAVLQRLYYDGKLSKEELLLLLTRDDAEDVIIADEAGKRAAKVAQEIWEELS